MSGAITSTYLGQYLAWRRPTNYDHLRMPQRVLVASATSTPLSSKPLTGFEQLPISTPRSKQTMPLSNLLTDTGTTARS
jgi:hypothetical protein